MAEKSIIIPSQSEDDFIRDLKAIVKSARGRAFAAINYAQVCQNWLIGKRIVEQEQDGKERADYGKYVIKVASEVLTEEFGRGYSETNIRNFRKFYVAFPDMPIQQTVSAEFQTRISQTVSDQSGLPIIQTPSELLPWSHYERLMRVDNLEARRWYENEAAKEMWSYRTLDRNINTQYYQRLLASQVKDGVIAEMKEKTNKYQLDKFSYIKNPTVLEFLSLNPNSGYKEADIEKAILDNMEDFLMEMGKGFALVARQQLIRTEGEDYYIDLTFYNYILKCFVLIDLKIGKIRYQDVGQMDMYVKMFDELKRTPEDNPTIGIILCAETDRAVAKYSVLKGNEQIFASKYQLVLPTVEELQDEIERQTEILKIQLAEHDKKEE